MGDARPALPGVLAAYGLADADFRLIRDTNNAVFEVREQARPRRRWVLRVHRPGYRSAAQIESELAFLQALSTRRTARLQVPAPVPALDGRLVVESGGRQCDLLTWVEGRLLSRPGRGFGPHAARAAGEAVALLHLAAQEFTPPDSFDVPTWGVAGLLTEASPHHPGDVRLHLTVADAALVDEVIGRTAELFVELARVPGSWGLIHADLILGNCLFSRARTGWRVGVLDFDDLGWGCFLYDLAPLLGNLLDDGRYADLGAKVLDGYREIRSLPDGAERHLPWLMAARHVNAITWAVGVHRTTGDRPPLERHLTARMAMMRDCVALARRTA